MIIIDMIITNHIKTMTTMKMHIKINHFLNIITKDIINITKITIKKTIETTKIIMDTKIMMANIITKETIKTIKKWGMVLPVAPNTNCDFVC